MLFFKMFLYAVSFLFLSNGWHKLIKTKQLKKNIIIEEKYKNNLNIIILIPVFKESKIIEETVSYFQRIMSEKVEVYYITTDKELSKITGKNETLQNLLQYVDNKHIINYPSITGDKSSQLNYAIKHLIGKYDGKNTYFGVFDADSRPDFGVLNYISFDKDRELVYQMMSIYNTNYNKISNICKANAILQTRWSFYFEYDKLQKNNEYGYQKNLMYLIGHGLFIRGDLLGKYLFPESSITEDIAYGYKLCLKGFFAKPLLYYDYCSVPNKLSTNIKQISRRFYGEFEFVLKNIFVRNKNKKLFYKRCMELVCRGYGGFIILLVFIIAFIGKFWLILIILCFGLIMDGISFIRIAYNMSENRSNKLIIYFYSILKNILDAIPLTISIYELIFNHIKKKKKEFIKTDR